MNLLSYLNRQTKLHRNHPGYKASQDLFHIIQKKVQKNNPLPSVKAARLSTPGLCYEKCKLMNLQNFETKPRIFHQVIYCNLLIPCSVQPKCCVLQLVVLFCESFFGGFWAHNLAPRVQTEICQETLCSFVLLLHSTGTGRRLLETKSWCSNVS